MASPTFLRWGGLALLAGSLVLAISIALSVFIPGPLGPYGPPPVWDAWIGVIGGIILLIGLPALYTVQSKQAGMIGLLGIIGLFVAFLLLAVVSNIIAAIAFANFVPPSKPLPVVPQPPLFVLIIFVVGGVFLIAGSILFGLALLRTKVFASWTASSLIVLSIVSTVLFFLPFPVAFLIGNIATVLYVLLFTWYGYNIAFQTSPLVEVTAAGETSEPSTSS
jgi:hypothetical protein